MPPDGSCHPSEPVLPGYATAGVRSFLVSCAWHSGPELVAADGESDESP